MKYSVGRGSQRLGISSGHFQHNRFCSAFGHHLEKFKPKINRTNFIYLFIYQIIKDVFVCKEAQTDCLHRMETEGAYHSAKSLPSHQIRARAEKTNSSQYSQTF